MGTENIKIPIGKEDWTLVTTKHKFILENPSNLGVEYAWFNRSEVKKEIIGDILKREYQLRREDESGDLYIRFNPETKPTYLYNKYINETYITLVLFY